MNLVELIPELDPILHVTYDAIVYQEQVMQIFQSLAGYSLGQADNIRRAMSKKKQYVIDAERPNFVYGNEELGIEGCVNRGISEYAANKLYDSMVDFAKYAFNKSHAAAYAVVSYQTAWLKYHYPAEFFTGLLCHTEFADAPKYISEAKETGIEVSPPDINLSAESFSLVGDTIVFGLSSVKGIKSAAGEIIENRGSGYDSFADYMLRGHSKKTVTEALIKAGAFDHFCNNRQALLLVLPQYSEIVKKIKDKKSKICTMEYLLEYSFEQKKKPDELFRDSDELNAFVKSKGHSALGKWRKVPSKVAFEKKIEDASNDIFLLEQELNGLIIPINIDEDKRSRLDNEKEVLGLYVSENPLDSYVIPEYSRNADSLSEHNNITVCGIVTNLALKKQRCGDNAGATLAFFDLEDKTGKTPVKVFAKAFEQYGEKITEGAVLSISGKCYADTYGAESSDVDDEDHDQSVSVIYSVIAKKISEPPLKREEIVIRMDNVLDYHRNYEKIIGHKDDSGIPLLVMFSDGIIREADFLVNKDIGYDFPICS